MKALILFSAIIILASCGKDDVKPQAKNGSVTFYTTQTGNWNLILDGIEYGKLKRASQMPVCGDPLFQNYSLAPGQHTADAKNLDGFAWGNPVTFTVPDGGCIQIKLPE